MDIKSQTIQLFRSPGASLLHNPFGDAACFFLGMFFPFNPEDDLISIQCNFLNAASQRGGGYFFEGAGVDDLRPIGGDIAAFLKSRSLENEGFCDLNVYFPDTHSGLCVSQEERLFLCSSKTLDIESLCANSVKGREYIDVIYESVNNVKDYIRLLSTDRSLRIGYQER